MSDKGDILVVDDTPMILNLITDILVREGYQVRSEDCGENALESVEDSPPELILMDILMPGMDGFEVLRQLKAKVESRDIPVIFLSGIREVEQVVEGLKLGAVDFISKPFQRDELLARVRNQMELFRLRDRLERQAADLRLVNEQLLIEIEERKRAEEALREGEAHYRAVTQSANDAIVTVDGAGNIVSWNRGAEKIFGYMEAEISGQSVIRIMPARYRDRHLIGMSRLLAGGESQVMGKTVELDGMRKDGTEFPIEFSLAKWETADRRFYTAILRDITERKRYQENLEYFAVHDALTGLLNRHSLNDMLNRSIAKAKRGEMSSLLYMDLDNFKEVNDSVGHSLGDEILITLARILRQELRTEDVVFRLGGDEFAVLIDGMESREALPAAERLRSEIDAYPFKLSGREFHLSLSIGLIQIDGTLSPGELLSQADSAMYQAKTQGKNRIAIFGLKGKA
jgi:diguanylate cyclase (GGDEF)-like protein/PAS domain S-box-containing protein